VREGKRSVRGVKEAPRGVWKLETGRAQAWKKRVTTDIGELEKLGRGGRGGEEVEEEE
jgi:hypothetical protein